MDKRETVFATTMGMLAQKHDYYEGLDDPSPECEESVVPNNKEEARHQNRHKPLSHFEKLRCKKQHGKRW